MPTVGSGTASAFILALEHTSSLLLSNPRGDARHGFADPRLHLLRCHSYRGVPSDTAHACLDKDMLFFHGKKCEPTTVRRAQYSPRAAHVWLLRAVGTFPLSHRTLRAASRAACPRQHGRPERGRLRESVKSYVSA